MFGRFFDLQAIKLLSRKSNFLRWLYAARELRLKLNSGCHPIYLDYPVNPVPRYGYGKPVHKKLYEKLKKNSSQYEETIKKFSFYSDKLSRISINETIPSAEPFWKNRYIEGLDPVTLYCFPSLLNSKLYIEIGSGNSTKFVRRAIHDNNLKTKIISIDPQPRREIDSICDEVIRQPLEDVNITLFDDLNSDDILMIDNSHRCFQNSDVTTVFLEILPRLKPGTLIYIDDIYLPSDYPPEWKFRYYSEQYLLAVLLLADVNRYDVILPCTFIAHDEYLKRVVDSLWDEIGLPEARGYGNGFWMVVRSYK